MNDPRTVHHRRITLEGIEVFYREAGTRGAPAILLPHGYPCSSYQYRNLLAALGDRFHMVAPDFPGFGYSGTPRGFSYDFSGYADFLDGFASELELTRYALYLHDYGSQIGLRLAIKHPERVTALIIQNGDVYEDALGPKYAFLKEYFAHPTREGRRKFEEAVSEEGFKDEFLNQVDPEVAASIPPDLWKLHWPLLNTPKRREIMVSLMEGLKENLEWFPRYQAYLRQHQPRTLIVWGPRDGYMPEESARAYLRDLPNAQLHLFADGGHWLLETHLEQVSTLVEAFMRDVVEHD